MKHDDGGPQFERCIPSAEVGIGAEVGTELFPRASAAAAAATWTLLASRGVWKIPGGGGGPWGCGGGAKYPG